MREDLLWKNVLKRVKNEVNSLVYTTWFEHTKLKRIDNNKVIISVPTELHQKYLYERHYKMIINCLSMETDEINEVSFLLEDELTDEGNIGYVARHAMKDFVKGV